MSNKQNKQLEEKGMIAFQYLLKGEHSLSEALFIEVLEELKESQQEDVFFALCLDGLGQTYLCQGSLEKAEKYFKEALALYTERFLNNEYNMFSTLCNLAVVYEGQKQYLLAESLYEQALSLGEKALGHENIVLVHGCLKNLEKLKDKLGKSEEANLIRTRIAKIKDSEEN
jgi:tetratricopeptide (TPR) repeat protein